MAKAQEYRDLSIEELEATCGDLQKELFHLKNAIASTKKVEKPHLIRLKQKDLARALTVISEKRRVTQQSSL
jgi:large subunit ribosomal protein L29